MGNGTKDLRGKYIPDMYEKGFIIARYFIKLKRDNIEFSEKDVFDMWQNSFPSDFRISKHRQFKLQDSEEPSCLVLENTENIDEGIIKDYNNKWKEIYCWLTRYICTHSLEECNKKINKYRDKRHKRLLRIYKPLKYYVINTTATPTTPGVATFTIKNKDGCRNGSFDSLMKYAKKLKEQKENAEK